MKLWRLSILLMFTGLVVCEKEDDVSTAFLEAAQTFFNDKKTVSGLQGIASAFMQTDSGKQVGDMLTGSAKAKENDMSQMLNGLSSLISGNQNGQGMDSSLLNVILDTFASSSSFNNNKKKAVDHEESGGIDFDSMLNIASMFLGQNGQNAEGLMGLLPMILENFSSGNSDRTGFKKRDHSDHSWYMPPILENLHVMWDHFSNSDLGQALWKNSGLANIVGQMTDNAGHIQYERLLESFENPALRRRWIKSLTNFVADWISHISDPTTQQRYLTTAQFVGNSFLKSQGYPKSAMFEPSKPAESLSRLVNAVAMRHLNMKIDSYKYIKPAVAYIQELMSLASEKGFIVSRINARELSNRLSDTINNDIIGPLLKAYRAYKWAVKMPSCAKQILCSINEKSTDSYSNITLRQTLTKVASFPAAWAISTKVGANFWNLYGAITESTDCHVKYPMNCQPFHEEEIRVTTEYAHSEL